MFSGMGSEAANTVDDRGNISKSRNNPGKVPKKIHKAEREKLKRDHMNDFFSDLEKATGLEHPNNGKASILRETMRRLGELLTQVDGLKKENAALLSESNYVASEKNELVEETCALDDQIKRLQREINERGNFANSHILQPVSNDSTNLPENHAPLPLVGHASESTPVIGPVYVMQLHHEQGGFLGPCPEVSMSKTSVSKPRPRYPLSSDIWPSHILAKQTNVTEDV